MRRLLLTAAVTSLITSAAWARPAVVRVFETKVRATPGDGAVVAVLIEGQRVSVSETAENGWRRVRLADGKTAWIEDQALFLPNQLPSGVAPPAQAGTPAQPTPVAPAPGSGPAVMTLPATGGPATVITPVPERPFKVVADLDDLRAAVEQEPALLPRVEALESSARTSSWIFYSGIASGVLLATVPQIVLAAQDKDPQPLWLYAGGALLLGTQVGAWWTSVGEEEMTPVIEDFNKKHPDTPLKFSDE